MTKHKHYDMIVAWAKGKSIQYRNKDINNEWTLLENPYWDSPGEFRIKPDEPKKTVGYRRYVYNLNGEYYVYSVVNQACDLLGLGEQWVKQTERFVGFVQWIDTEWQYHEVEK